MRLREQKEIHLRELRKDMKSINPNLSIYKRMENECASIIRELETMK